MKMYLTIQNYHSVLHFPISYSILILMAFHDDDIIHCFAAIDCGSLDNPDDGIVSLNGTRLNSVAGYHCNIGYELVGDTERHCTEQGVWSGNQPTCEGKAMSLQHTQLKSVQY